MSENRRVSLTYPEPPGPYRDPMVRLAEPPRINAPKTDWGLLGSAILYLIPSQERYLIAAQFPKICFQASQ